METILRVSTKEAQRWDGTLGVTSESIDEHCLYCNAQPNEPCRSRITKQPTPIPHNCRTKRAERRRLGLPVDEPPALGS